MANANQETRTEEITMAPPVRETIPATHSKAKDIFVSSDGATYGNDALCIHFQEGPIEQYGVRNGAFESELLAILIHRAQKNDQAELLQHLQDARAVLDPPAAITPTS